LDMADPQFEAYWLCRGLTRLCRGLTTTSHSGYRSLTIFTIIRAARDSFANPIMGGSRRRHGTTVMERSWSTFQ
jgi:hypothetical protein